MARELGLFAKYGVDVELRREVGWATIRDKVIYRELDLAQAPAGLVVAASCGLGSVQADCLAGMVLNLNGNAITLSSKLWKRGVRDGKTLRREILSSEKCLTFGVVHPYSAHSFLLRQWLRENGVELDRDVRFVVVPPAQVHANLKAGHLDGYCVGEPWNSVAVLAGTGWVVATSADLAPGHPEKVLMARRDFAEQHDEEHVAIIAALIESCAFCDRPENRERIAEMLAQPEYVGVPCEALRVSLSGAFNYGNGRVEKQGNFHIFGRDNANEPTAERAEWVVGNLKESGVISAPSVVPMERASEWFRADIFQRASKLIKS